MMVASLWHVRCYWGSRRGYVVNTEEKISAQELVGLREKTERLAADLDEARKRLAIMQVVHEVAQSVTSELNLEPLLHKILSSAVQVMDASAGSLLLLDEFKGFACLITVFDQCSQKLFALCFIHSASILHALRHE